MVLKTKIGSLRKSVLLFILVLLFIIPLSAMESQFIADSLHGTLGDIITFRWIIQHESESSLRFSDIDIDGSGIEILDRQEIPSESETELVFKTAVYDSIGTYHFPSMVVYSDDPEGVDSLFLSGPDLHIYSILTPADTTFRTIKGLHKIKMPFNLVVLMWFIVIIILGLIIYLLIKRNRKADPIKKETKILVPPEQAHVIALRALEKLRRSKYLHLNQFKAFYSELTHILKEYYESRYLIDALEYTTNELMDVMKSMTEFEPDIMAKTSKILELADLIKFAKGSSDELQSGKYLIDAIDIINQTKIKNDQGDNT